jgi:hypothetical protein
MPKKSKGRRKGSRNKGYFYRTSHTVWVAQEGKRFIPLTDKNGVRLRDASIPEAVVKEAYARFLLSQRPAPQGAGMTLFDLAQHYLAHIERTKGAAATMESRADTLFDFTTGYGRK